MNISCYQMLTILSVFSTKIITSDLSYSGTIIKAPKNSCSSFATDFLRKKSLVGACTGEENPEALCKIRGAECLGCLGICCCTATGYGAIVYAATDPVSAFALGSVSGCGGSLALTMVTNNNDRCSITGQHTSSTNAATDRNRFLKAFPELQSLLEQKKMGIAPSPIEFEQNPILQ